MLGRATDNIIMKVLAIAWHYTFFKLTRISNIEVSCTHFQRKQIDTSIKPWNNINSTRKTKIQIEFLPAYKDEICEWLNLDNITNNGEIVSASAEVQDSDNLYTKLIQEANKVKLISPLSMVKKLVEKCKNIEQIYLA